VNEAALPMRRTTHIITMKLAATIAAVLLGLVFIVFGLNGFLNFIDMGAPPPPDSAMGHFFAAFFPTGYLKFVKALEILGGVLVLLPRLRNLGLLILGPIIVNIIAAHVFLMGGANLGMPIALGVISVFLLWSNKSAWLRLIGA
jgi:hypothetical protein